MSLMDKISNQPENTQVRMNITGTDGIGKSTFGASAPKPIFICAEDGLRYIDVPHFPVCETYNDILQQIKTLGSENHDYKTIILDTTDAAEKLCQEQVKETHNIKSIEALGFGKGYTESLELFHRMLKNLEALSIEKKMHVILLSHVQIRIFADPEHEPYDRYELNTHKKIASLIRAWVDFNFFANHLVTTVKSGQGFNEKHRGKTYSDKRYLFTKRTAAFDAKSRLTLPEKINFTWPSFVSECKKLTNTTATTKTINEGGQNV